jgi:superfamily II DNA or RNA helicase/transcriptional regulator with XRE-family HTH domain
MPENEHLPTDAIIRMKALRQRLHLSQQQFADLTNVPVTLFKQWENGTIQPPASYWQRILLAETEGLRTFSNNGTTPGRVYEAGADYTTHTDDAESEEGLLPDFLADPDVVRTFVEGQRLAYGHLFNSTFATEISHIDPLPHQLIAVYDHMLKQPRLRFLLADDAGAGKTIMTGLYLREMLARRLIFRVLIVPPAGLVGNWAHEMHALFNLPFRIITGSDARLSNPFCGSESDLLIVSVDTLAGERMFSRLQEGEVQPYDLVIFDEAHKLAANRGADFRIRRTDRYRLAEALAGVTSEEKRWSLPWSCRHLLLLTATPHMGKDFPYYCLWKLLEPDALSTLDAFNAYPSEARRRHFLRRTKEELVYFDGRPIYPTRISDTMSYKLSQGEVSEQTLYDNTTHYIQTFYNRAQLLNRSAARLAMSVFQRRLASSTWALLCSFDRRAKKLEKLIEAIRTGQLDWAGVEKEQRRLDGFADVFDEKTADEESDVSGKEENERNEDELLGGTLARSLKELEVELQQVVALRDLAEQVYKTGEESKFEKLREILTNPLYRNEKLLIFTEHRDTLEFLVRRLKGMGLGGQIAQIHGGMNYQEREGQVAAFRKASAEAGAMRYMIATDAAGEGINLQVCYLMVNYDIPWNPARLEQRMGRIHRYGQKHNPVYIMNLVAEKTREGRVMTTLLEKMESIRKELGSDKVFDVIGRLFQGVSLSEYLAQMTPQEQQTAIEQRLFGTLTPEQVRALEARERAIFGEGGSVRSELPSLRQRMEQKLYQKLLPGYVRHFVEQAAPLMQLGIDGNLDGIFQLVSLIPNALNWLLPLSETYPAETRGHYTLYPSSTNQPAIFLHPGEPIFDRWQSVFCDHFSTQVLRGAVFADPSAEKPYYYHLALITITREADPTMQAFKRSELLQCQLVGLRQEESGEIALCPVEHLLLLQKAAVGAEHDTPVAIAATLERAKAYAVTSIAEQAAMAQREALQATLAERERFIEHGFTYQNAELFEIRKRLSERAQVGDARAKGELTRIKAQQKELQHRKNAVLTVLRREPELIVPGEVSLLAHALVLPSHDPADSARFDADVEAIALQWVRAFEEARGATVKDVSTASKARTAGLEDWPGFDLLALRPGGETIAIEVKGRAGISDIELTENEYIKACNLRHRYWLYVVYECAKAVPRLLRIQDPFGKLIARAKHSVILDDRDIFAAAEPE